MQVDNWLIGSDIEVFIQEEQTGKYISSQGDEYNGFSPRVPGTKHDPYYIDEEKQFAVETDNVSVEFLVPPTRNCGEFIQNINYMMRHIKDRLPIGLIPVARASARFDADQLLSPDTLVFGCDRDLNAWTGEYNPRPDNTTNLRSNGFHIHIGYDNPNEATSIQLIRAMDYFVGIPSVLVDRDTDRRTLYGKAGSFRHKPYGVEYRTLSGVLIGNDEHIKQVFENTIKAINFINSGKVISNELMEEIVSIINTTNVEAAERMCNIIKTETINI